MKLNHLIVLCIVFSLHSQAQSPPGSGWTKVFEDNFNGSSLNTNNWSARTDDIFRSNLATVGGGVLRIKSAFPSGGTPTGAWVASKRRYDENEKYGYYEARIRINGSATGNVWPTWWIWGGNYRNGGPAPSATEIDLMEYSGFSYHGWNNRATSSHHYGRDKILNGAKHITVTAASAAQRNAFEWHTWAMHWTPTELTFYYDGVPYMSSDQPAEAAAEDVPMQLILSAAPHGNGIRGYNRSNGGRQPDHPVASKAAKPGQDFAVFEIDWVRKWTGGSITGGGNNCNYTLMDGKALDIGAYGSNVYVVGSNNYLYKFDGNKGWNLANSSKKIKRLDVAANGDVWAIGLDNKLWQYQNGVWLDKNGTGIDIGVSGSTYYLLGTDQRIRRYTGNGTYSAPLGTIRANRIDVSGANRPWIRAANDGLYQWVGDSWHRKGTQLINDIGIEPDGGIVTVTGTDQKIYHYIGNGAFRQINGLAVSVTVNSNGVPWVINKYNNIYRRGCSGEKSLYNDNPIDTSLKVMNIYPNPSKGQTSFDIYLEKSGPVSLQVFDLNGREVNTITNKVMDKGIHRVQWNSENMINGIYIVKLTTPTQRKVARWVLNR